MPPAKNWPSRRGRGCGNQDITSDGNEGIPCNILAANWEPKHAKRAKGLCLFLTVFECGRTYQQ